uniref:Uncharacterized protein n=1 Tax=Opuntia streptacantha TaxID=393608 RepID=A0A7C9DLE3_OPUST
MMLCTYVNSVQMLCLSRLNCFFRTTCVIVLNTPRYGWTKVIKGTVMLIGTVCPCPNCIAARPFLMARVDRAKFLSCSREGSVLDRSGLRSCSSLEFSFRSRPGRADPVWDQ